MERVSEEEVFSYYLGISIDLENAICSPLRVDNNPTCRFYYTESGVLTFRDYAGHFSGDCFTLVQHLHGCKFTEALEIIAKDFKLLQGEAKPRVINVIQEKKIRQKKIINYQIREWTKEDLKYWAKYFITKELLQYFEVFPVRHIWIDTRLHYSHNLSDPAYVYVFNKEIDFKIYFPKRPKKAMRFLCNTNCLQGYNKLPKKGNTLIITKSYKDVIALFNFGIPAVAPQAESQIPTQEQFNDLSKRFKNIYSLYDFDWAGVRSANKMRKVYGIQPIFLTNGRFKSKNYGAKDPTDLLDKIGPQELLKVIQEFKKIKINNPVG